MWFDSVILEYLNYKCGPSNNLRTFVRYSYIQVEVGNMGGVVLLTLCTKFMFLVV